MIADAVREALPEVKSISVDLQTIRFSDPGRGQRYTYLTPMIAQDYLVAFDEGQPLEPFEFRLNSPVQTTYIGRQAKGESRTFEGMKATRSSKTGVKMAGSPMPLAALHMGAGYPSQYGEIRKTEPDPITEETRPDTRIPDASPDKAVGNEIRKTEPAPEEAVEDEIRKTEPGQKERWAEVKAMVGNVTLSTKGRGHIRVYGMRQLGAPGVPRKPAS